MREALVICLHKFIKPFTITDQSSNLRNYYRNFFLKCMQRTTYITQETTLQDIINHVVDSGSHDEPINALEIDCVAFNQIINQ